MQWVFHLRNHRPRLACCSIELDVTSKESILRAVELIGSENDGRLDILINK